MTQSLGFLLNDNLPLVKHMASTGGSNNSIYFQNHIPLRISLFLYLFLLMYLPPQVHWWLQCCSQTAEIQWLQWTHRRAGSTWPASSSGRDKQTGSTDMREHLQNSYLSRAHPQSLWATTANRSYNNERWRYHHLFIFVISAESSCLQIVRW